MASENHVYCHLFNDLKLTLKLLYRYFHMTTFPFEDFKKQLLIFCKPLFTHTPFTYFDYEQYSYDGYYFSPCLIPEFGQAAVENSILPSLEELHRNKSHFIYLSPHLPIPEATTFSKFSKNIAIGLEFDIFHRLCLLFYTSQHVEVFVFGLPKQTKNAIEIVMNHISFLEKFCIYLREVGQDLFDDARKSKIIFDEIEDEKFFSNQEFNGAISYKDFFNDIKIKKYKVKGRSNKAILSEREFQCLF